MNHVKKMILVPHDSVARLNDPTPSTAQAQSSSLDDEMRHIMSKKYADDSLKWKEYEQALQRYLYFTNERHKPLQISLESQSNDVTFREKLAGALPKTYKESALRIFDYLDQSGTVTWDSTGTVSLNNHILHNSNIIDLISDLTRPRKNFEPLGLSSFIKTLANINIPLELVGNEQRRRDIITARHQGGGQHR